MLNRQLFSVTVFFVAVWALFGSLSAGAAGLDNELRSKYQGKVLMLRNFYCGQDLKFNEQGNLVSGGREGAWTICRDIRIGDVKIQEGEQAKLTITGQRIYLIRGSGQMNFRDVRENEPDGNKKLKAYQDLLRSQEVSIEVQLPRNPDSTSIQMAMDKLFYASEQEFSQAVPDLWKCFFHTEGASCPGAKRDASDIVETGPVEWVGGKVKAPEAIHTPDPSYSNEARLAKYQGTTVLSVVVDATGRVKLIRVTRPLGMGLDEQAAAAIGTWKFNPAERDGTPVAVQVNVEVRFNLY